MNKLIKIINEEFNQINEIDETPDGINPNLGEFVDSIILGANKEIERTSYDLEKYRLQYEYIKFNTERYNLIKEFVVILASAKFVYDSPTWLKSNNGEYYVFKSIYDIKGILFEHGYREINRSIEGQVKYYNADKKFPQPTWINDFKKYVVKLKQLDEKIDGLYKELYH